MLPKLLPRFTPSPLRPSKDKSHSPLHGQLPRRRSNSRADEAEVSRKLSKQSMILDKSYQQSRYSASIQRHVSFESVRSVSIKRNLKLAKCMHEYSTVKEGRLHRHLKQTLCQALERRYSVRLPYIELGSFTEKQILEHAKQLWHLQLARVALLKMKRRQRLTSTLRCIEAELGRVHMAAYSIQQHWRSYKVLCSKVHVLAKRQLKERQEQAATDIQRVFRGHR
jgi:hypothetical protein